MKHWFGLALLAACGGSGGDSLGVAPECNPLGGASCVLPLPSSIYLKTDTTPTGFRVDFPATGLPQNIDHVGIKPDFYNKRDGFSANAPILMAFPGGVDPTPLPPINNPAASLDPASPTVILDLTSGKRVLHFAELDVAAKTPDRQALMMWPLERLLPGHRYGVAIRKSLKAKDGSALPIPVGFQAILDGKKSDHARLERVRADYPALFAALASAGVPETDLVVAWDFVTASNDSVRGDMQAVRDVGVAAMGSAGANLTFRVNPEVVDVDPAITLKVLHGTFDVPLVLTENGGRDGILARDAAGKPKVVGTYQAPFTIVVPACAATQKPVPVLLYGHGLMGSNTEADGGYPRKMAQFLCVIVMATDWRGMSEADLATVGLALNDASEMPKVMEKLPQGILSFIALEQIARGPMARAPELQDAGASLIDPARVYYYGLSQGGIFGGTFMAYDPFVTQGVLGVGGGNYSLLIQRSADWPLYGGILNGAYRDKLDDQVAIYLIQMGWDLTDPISTAQGLAGLAGDPVPGTPRKQILMQIAVGDSQVPNVGSELVARIMGLPMLAPAVLPVPGLDAKDGPLPNAFTMWNEHAEPMPPLTNSATPDNGTHGSVRQLRAVNQQMKTFFETGQVVQTCLKNGAPVACDCADPDVCGPHL